MTEKKGSKLEELKFEEAIGELEEIVEFLEGSEVSLDEALKKYEEGIKLARFLAQKLAQAEKKIEILTRSLSGELKMEPFEPGEEKEGKKKKDSSSDSRENESKGEELLF